MTISRWSDDRLDDLQYRVGRVEPVVASVGRLEERLDGLSRELRANTKATEHVATQMESVQMEPVARARNRRDQIVVAVCSALLGGGIAVLSAALAGAH